MKVYKVKIKKYDGNVVERTVLASNVTKAIVNAERYVKKHFYSTTEILSVEEYLKIDVVYKS